MSKTRLQQSKEREEKRKSKIVSDRAERIANFNRLKYCEKCFHTKAEHPNRHCKSFK